MNDDKDYIRQAMAEAELAVKEGNAPFACVVVAAGTVVLKEHDRVKELMDPTAHGEVNAIRKLCKQLNVLSLRDFVFYTTSEPCPTCLSSLIKAKVAKIVYGAKTEATASLPISAEYLASYAKKYPIEVVGGVLADECLGQRERLLS